MSLAAPPGPGGLREKGRSSSSPASLLVLGRLSFREVLNLPLFLGFLAAAGLTATLPSASLGGRGPTLFALAAQAVGAGLAAGLAGPWVEGGLFRSPWLLAQVPSRTRMVLAGGVGQALSLLVLLLPALLLPLPAWQARAGPFHQGIPLVEQTFRPGPEGFLSSSGAQALLRFSPRRPARALVLRAEPVLGSAKDYRPATLLLSLEGGPWRSLGEVGIEPRVFRFPLEPARPLEEVRLRRKSGPGLFVYFPPGGIQALGPSVPAGLVWVLCWIAAWNLAFLAAMALSWAGTRLSRPVALFAGGGWALLALADPLFRPGLPLAPYEGISPGWDLCGGRGWLPLAGGLLFLLLLAWKPGRAWTRREAGR